MNNDTGEHYFLTNLGGTQCPGGSGVSVKELQQLDMLISSSFNSFNFSIELGTDNTILHIIDIHLAQPKKKIPPGSWNYREYYRKKKQAMNCD